MKLPYAQSTAARTTHNLCRHFLGLYPDNRPSCAKGRDVRAWARRCNGGSDHGIGLRLPCTRQTDDADKPLFDCPDIDRKTQDEVDQERADMSARMDIFVKGFSQINSMKAKMIANHLPRAVATCPWCGEKDALNLTVALNVNNHMCASCRSCGEGFME